jgi:hypothetical protein
MKWQDIRKHYPKQWLLIEAIKAHSKDNEEALDRDSDTMMEITLRDRLPFVSVTIVDREQRTIQSTPPIWSKKSNRNKCPL